MSVYNHRPMVPPTQSRLVELLDAVRAEFDQIAQDAIICKTQRDEYEHKSMLYRKVKIRSKKTRPQLLPSTLACSLFLLAPAPCLPYSHRAFVVNSQIQEMSLFQQTLMDMERTQHMIKKQYEEEIARLRQQLEQIQHSGAPPAPPPASGYGTPYAQPPPPPPPLSHPQPQQSMMESNPHRYPTSGPMPNGPPPTPRYMNAPPQHPGTPPLPPSQIVSPARASMPPAAAAKPPPPPPGAGPLGVGSGNPPPSLSGISRGLGDMDPEAVPPSYKIEGPDWFALFNPKVPRNLKLDLLCTFDHDSVVCCVKFSVDGRYLAAGCNKATYIYDTSSGSRIAILQDDNTGHDGDLYIRSVSFSPDGRHLATGAEDKQIRVWDIQAKRIRRVLQGHEEDIYSLEFSHDGSFIVSGSGDRTARIWNWEDNRCVHTLRIPEHDQKDPGVTSVAISRDDQLIAAGSLDKVVRVWDVQTGRLLERLDGHKDSVYSVAFMPDSKTLVSGSLDKTLRLWQLGTMYSNDRNNRNPCKTVFSGHKDFVLSVATTPDGKWIVSGSKDRGVQFWDPRTGQTQFMLQGHKNSVISVATSPGRRPLFATGSGDNRARIWIYEPY
ncbi:WD40-repeat-containing domain protein [Dichotomocladium elegans]|nr:WD40-repeat-containing domain protein [Dichotomocladium elegans]